MGVEILNKMISEKEIYYTKLLNCLHDVYIHLGYTPDRRFIETLHFTKAKTPEEIKEVKNLNKFEEFKVKEYSEHLGDIIYKDFDKVSPTDKLKLILFQKRYPGTEEYFNNIIYKSKDECIECETPKEKEFKVVKKPLGMYTKEE